MDFRLSEEQEQVRQMVREFAQREIAPHVMEWDEAQYFPREVMRGLAELGLMGAIFEEELGGAALSYVDYVHVIEELAAVESGIALGVAAHNSLAAGHLRLAGNAEQHKRWLPKLTSGEWIGCWALTEPGSGSDAAGLTIEVASGDPSVLIADYAAETETDIVLAGTIGRTGIMSVLMGSVAVALVDEVPCDLLIVPGAAGGAPA